MNISDPWSCTTSVFMSGDIARKAVVYIREEGETCNNNKFKSGYREKKTSGALYIMWSLFGN